jgi:FixJ family two-component response regulator
MHAALTIAVVDDEAGMREATRSLLASAGFATTLFASAEDFLASSGADQPDCIVLDVALPGMSGLDLHRHLASCGTQIPIVFVSGHDVDGRVRSTALRDGAGAFLHKPFLDNDLLRAIDSALDGRLQTPR